MKLTKEQQAILDGSKGETMAKVMKTLVMYGDAFDAKRMVPITSKYGHTVLSFAVTVTKPVLELYEKILAAGETSKQKFTADPRPTDNKVPKTFLQNLIFKFMYSPQKRLEKQLVKFGITSNDDYTCTCYLPEVGNVPKKGDILSWAESSAVVYANSVLGARCNRNSGIIEMMGSVAGFVPEFGLLLDEGRKADWIVEIKTKKKPEAQLLGSAVGMKVLEQVPYVVGLDKWIGTELDEATTTYLKDFGAATASNGSVGLYHIENLTPEAKESGKDLIKKDAKVYVIDDAELERVKNSYPVIWEDPNATPKLCFLGCPHMSLQQLKDWTDRVCNGLKENGNKKVLVPTVFTSSPAVLKEFEKTEYAKRLEEAGVITSSICPLMYMNNPLCKKMPVITSSNKLRTYTTSRFYQDDDIVRIITKEGK